MDMDEYGLEERYGGFIDFFILGKLVKFQSGKTSPIKKSTIFVITELVLIQIIFNL
jgi:hypothetical protein